MNRLVAGRNPRKGQSLVGEDTPDSIACYNKASTTGYPNSLDDEMTNMTHTEIDDGYCRRTEKQSIGGRTEDCEVERAGRKSAV
jgi:hypothetical protein